MRSWFAAAVVACATACATGGSNDGDESSDGAPRDTGPRDTGGAVDSASGSDSTVPDTTTPDTAVADDGPADTSMCGPGQKWCGTFCASVSIDVDHCGDCGKKCPDVANGTPTCTAGVCGGTCKAPFAKCAGDTGCDTNTSSDTDHCGGCGKKCASGPTTTATCASGACGASCKSGYVSLSSHCTVFGGAFESNSAGCTSCNNGNAYAGGSCACPSGTTAGSAFALHNDCSGVRPATLQFCEASGAPAGVWGGAYQADDAVACASSCRVANAKTGGCSCPSGYAPLSLRVLVRTSCSTIIGSNVIACLHPSAPLDNFGGAYEVDDPVPGGLGCRVSNPRTGGCSCPSGFTGRQLRTIVDAGGGQIGAQLYLCTR